MIVRTTEDGSLRILHRFWRGSEPREKEVRWTECLETRDHSLIAAKSESKAGATRLAKARSLPPKPSANHPWQIRNRIDVELALAARREAGMYTQEKVR